MSATTERAPAIHCRLCSWKTDAPDPVVREQQWQAHYDGVHPQPLRTRCMVPPYCGWTATADDLPKLRRLRDNHEATHKKNSNTRSQAR